MSPFAPLNQSQYANLETTSRGMPAQATATILEEEVTKEVMVSRSAERTEAPAPYSNL
jgi:hypothetical protein